MKLAIKSGHLIGRDPGAVGNGLEEARIVEAVQNECSRVLRANYVVDILDTDLLYTDDVPEINNWGADYAFEFHMNAASASAKGFETLTYPEPNSTTFQNKVHGKFFESVKALGITGTDRGKKTATDFYFLKGLKAPSIIVEIAFISNTAESKQASVQAVKLGERFAKDIASALGLKLKTPTPTPTGKTYRVVTGSFSERANADKRIADLKAKGFDSFIEIK